MNVQQALQETISIYSNPADVILHLISKNNFIEQVSIYDISGKQVLWQNSNFNQIDTSQMQSGLYNLHIETVLVLVIQKLIKK
ncbi:MAG: hypothetical protein ACI86C_001689 [Candidatus Latescibacterota bacterium]|jgi:hypothetical protein